MSMLRRFNKIPYLIQHLYTKVTTSIALLPSIMAIGFILLVGLMIYMERSGLTPWMEKRIPSFFLIKSWDVASSILTTLIGALISLMVFSFSMVMVLLNNAASNYSPRILPGLVANRFHQFVLGTFLGSIIYCILLVINMTPTQDKIPLPSFSVLLGILLGIICLLLFVLFIHSISESVQVGKILENLNVSTAMNMEEGTADKLADKAPPYMWIRWTKYHADRSGNLRSIDIKKLHQLCMEENFRIKLLIPVSRFVLEGSALFAVDKELEDEILAKVYKVLLISTSGMSDADYIVGFKFITEIAVKAMSPGINDPGTAISAIDYLTILFSKRMELPNHGAVHLKSKDGAELPTRIWLSIVSFDELLTYVLAPLRQYAKHDLMVTLKMLDMLSFLKSKGSCSDEYEKVIKRETIVIREDAKKHLTNSADYERVLQIVEQILIEKSRA